MPNYVKNKDLYNELIHCIDNSTYTTEFHNMVTMMAERLSLKLYYSQEEDRKDCIQNGIIKVYLYHHNFKRENKNAFAYITQILKNGMAVQFNKIYKKRYGIKEIRLDYLDFDKM